MSAHAYTKDQLVEQPAIGLFAKLGWTVAGLPPDAGLAGEPRDAGLLARILLERLQSLLVLNWRRKSAARSQLKLAIEDVLDTLPEAYGRPLYAQKCSALFEHIYESYPERDVGVYAT